MDRIRTFISCLTEHYKKEVYRSVNIYYVTVCRYLFSLVENLHALLQCLACCWVASQQTNSGRYVTSPCCLCSKPASFKFCGCKYVCMYACMLYVQSPFLHLFQVWPSKSRLFCSQSIDSERNHRYCWMWKSKSQVEILFSCTKSRFCKRRVCMQVKVINSRELKRHVSRNISLRIPVTLR